MTLPQNTQPFHQAAETAQVSSPLAWALAIAAQGFPVFPVYEMAGPGVCSCPLGAACPPKQQGKHPRTGIGGHKHATTNAEQIRAWWSQWPQANVAVAVPDGVVVVDIDPRNGGEKSAADLAEDPLRGLPSTREVETGGGGWHLYYQVQAGLSLPAKVPGSPGIDLKQLGGYVLAPPSNHASGGYYTGAFNEPIADAPAWLVALGTTRGDRKPRVLGTIEHDNEPGDPAVVLPLLRQLRALMPLGDGERQGYLLAFFGWAKRVGWATSELESFVEMFPADADQDAFKSMAERADPDGVKGPPVALQGDAKRNLPPHPNWAAIDTAVNAHPNAVARKAERDRVERERTGYDRIKILPAPGAAATAPQNESRPERVRVEVRPNQSETNAATVAAIVNATGLYQRNRRLVRVIEESSKDYTGAIISELPSAVLQSLISKHVHFWAMGADGKADDGSAKFKETERHPPKWCVDYVFTAANWPGVPHLTGIIETPAVRPDGSIIQEPGYDDATGFYFAPSMPFPPVPAEPSHADAAAALATLRDVFADFPFKPGADRDVPIAAVLSIVARPAIKGPVPAFLFDASKSRSGKGYLANVISLIALGRVFSPMHYPGSQAEQAKILAGFAVRGVPLLCFDNIVGVVFGGAAIEATVTAEDRVSLRILGKTETPEFAWRAVIVGTGNNVECTRDMSARIMRARLVPMVENPEDRPASSYRHFPLLPWVRVERARLVVAALTIVRAYFAAGCPNVGGKSIADFAAWARVVRDAMLWAGGDDVAVTRSEAKVTDTHSAALGAVLAKMHELDPHGFGKSARAWLPLLQGLKDELETLCPDDDEATPKAFGTVLRSARDNIVSGFQLLGSDPTKAGVMWRAVKA